MFRSTEKGAAKPVVLVGMLALPLVLVFVFAYFSKKSDQNAQNAAATGDIKVNNSGTQDGLPRLDWRELRELNIETGQASAKLKSLDGKLVRVPGFMVPLEDNQKDITDFLLVPNPQACIHVPPPPANQIVLVRMAGGNKTRVFYDPLWVTGYLRIMTVSHAYGKASYYMEAQSTEIYKE